MNEECPRDLTAERFLVSQPVGKIEEEAEWFCEVLTVSIVPFLWMVFLSAPPHTPGMEVNSRKPGPFG